MHAPKINQLEELLNEHVCNGKRLLDFQLTPLTAPGENYMSTMLALKMRLEGEETLEAVVKCFPQEGNHHDDKDNKMKEFMEKMSVANFHNELVFYQEIVPLLKEFQRKHEVPEFETFPKLLASRRNLHGKDDEVDKDAVLVLENLTKDGYTNGDRHVGFDLDESRMVLKDLAEFHATPLALKLKDPETFEAKIKNRIRKPDGPPPDHDNKEKGPGGPPLNIIFSLLKQDSSVAGIVKRFQDHEQEFKKRGLNPFDMPAREPFATIVHNDMWLNNTMQKYKNGQLVKNMLVDFQMYSIGSPLNDLLFLIFSSVKPAVISLHLDRLLRYYHENFINTLKAFGCNTRPFAYDKFLEEIKETGPIQLGHSIFMAIVIFGKKGARAVDFDKPPDKYSVSNLALEKSKLALKVFNDKGWI